MRAWGLGYGLRSAGFSDVTIAFAADAARGRDLLSIPGVETFERSHLDDFIAAQRPDAVVLQHWGLHQSIRRPLPCPMAMDLAGPHLLERQLWGSADPAGDLKQKLSALAAADHLVCSGRFQRHYFLPFLVQAGHDPRTLHCPVIPFSLSPDLPERAPKRDFSTFLYAGTFLPWQDPEGPLRTLLRALEEKQKGRLLFIGGPHPGGDVSGGRFDKLLALLHDHPLVEMLPPLPFDQLLQRMRSCGVALDLMPRNAERELAFPTRTVTYLWAGLPVIHNDYDELAEPIGRWKAGWTLPAEDSDSLLKLVQRLAGHREDTEKRSVNAQRLVRENLTWDRTIGPLADWCREPKRRERRAQLLVPGEPRTETKREVSARQGTIRYAPRPSRAQLASQAWSWRVIAAVLAIPVAFLLLLFFAAAELVRRIKRR
jgi:glycosyltransferase involved in cell wall biosynthesis